MKIQNKKYVISVETGIQQVVESYIRDKSLDSRFRANDEKEGEQWILILQPD